MIYFGKSVKEGTNSMSNSGNSSNITDHFPGVDFHFPKLNKMGLMNLIALGNWCFFLDAFNSRDSEQKDATVLAISAYLSIIQCLAKHHCLLLIKENQPDLGLIPLSQVRRMVISDFARASAIHFCLRIISDAKDHDFFTESFEFSAMRCLERYLKIDTKAIEVHEVGELQLTRSFVVVDNSAKIGKFTFSALSVFL